SAKRRPRTSIAAGSPASRACWRSPSPSGGRSSARRGAAAARRPVGAAGRRQAPRAALPGGRPGAQRDLARPAARRGKASPARAGWRELAWNRDFAWFTKTEARRPAPRLAVHHAAVRVVVRDSDRVHLPGRQPRRHLPPERLLDVGLRLPALL